MIQYIGDLVIQTQPLRSRKIIKQIYEIDYHTETLALRYYIQTGFSREFISEFFNLNFNKEHTFSHEFMMLIFEIFICPVITSINLRNLKGLQFDHALDLILYYLPRIQKFDCRNTDLMEDRNEQKFKTILMNCPQLTNLKITNPSLDLLLYILKKANLRKMTLEGTDICTKLTPLEVNKWPITNLLKLTFNSNHCLIIKQDTIAAILLKCPNLISWRNVNNIAKAFELIGKDGPLTRLEKISDNNLSETQLTAILKKCPNLRSLTMFYPEYYSMRRLHRLKLTNLEMHYFKMEAFIMNLSNFGGRLTKLRLFRSFDKFPLNQVFECCPHLYHLELEDIPIDFNDFIEPHPNLKNLIITFDNRQLNYPSCVNVFKFLPALENLELTYWQSLTPEDIVSTLPHWTNLKLLSIEDSPKLVWDTLWAILRNCRRLKHLHGTSSWSEDIEDEKLDNKIRAANSQVCFRCYYTLGREGTYI